MSKMKDKELSNMSAEYTEMLETQIRANLKLTKRLIEKDSVIHSLAHALLECSQCMEDMGRDSQNIILAEDALDSITDKGEITL